MILVPHREDRWGIYGHKGRIFRRAGYWSGSVSGVGVEHRRKQGEAPRASRDNWIESKQKAVGGVQV